MKTAKKVFQPALECAQHPKAGQNTQHHWVNGWDIFVIFVLLGTMACFMTACVAGALIQDDIWNQRKNQNRQKESPIIY